MAWLARGLPGPCSGDDHRPQVRLRPAGRPLRGAGIKCGRLRHRDSRRRRVDEPRAPWAQPGRDADPYGPTVAARYAPGLVSQGVAAELVAAKLELSRSSPGRIRGPSRTAGPSSPPSARAFDREILPGRHPGRAWWHGTRRSAAGHDRREAARTFEPVFERPELSRAVPRDQLERHRRELVADHRRRERAAADERAEMPRAWGSRRGRGIHSMAVCADDPLLHAHRAHPGDPKDPGALRPDPRTRSDHIEINEAFASVPLAWLAEFDVDPAEGQPARRRHRPRPSARRLGHPADDHDAPRPGGQRPALRPSAHVRGRRHGQRHHHRTPLTRAIRRTGDHRGHQRSIGPRHRRRVRARRRHRRAASRQRAPRSSILDLPQSAGEAVAEEHRRPPSRRPMSPTRTGSTPPSTLAEDAGPVACARALCRARRSGAAGRPGREPRLTGDVRERACGST